MTVAVGLFDFNDYTVERSAVVNLFKVTNAEGIMVDLVKEAYDGVLVSVIYDSRSYLLE